MGNGRVPPAAARRRPGRAEWRPRRRRAVDRTPGLGPLGDSDRNFAFPITVLVFQVILFLSQPPGPSELSRCRARLQGLSRGWYRPVRAPTLSCTKKHDRLIYTNTVLQNCSTDGQKQPSIEEQICPQPQDIVDTRSVHKSAANISLRIRTDLLSSQEMSQDQPAIIRLNPTQ
jgi:hypothetical protein